METTNNTNNICLSMMVHLQGLTGGSVVARCHENLAVQLHMSPADYLHRAKHQRHLSLPAASLDMTSRIWARPKKEETKRKSNRTVVVWRQLRELRSSSPRDNSRRSYHRSHRSPRSVRNHQVDRRMRTRAVTIVLTER